MSKRHTTGESAESNPAVEVDPDTAYGCKVAAKQLGLGAEEAAEAFATLSAEDQAALVAHGRAGHVAEARALLGIEPPAA